MPVKNDRWIEEMAQTRDMIKPFSSVQVRQGISFGLSSYGYDISLSDEFKIPNFDLLTEIDPKNHDDSAYTDVKVESIVIPPNSFLLARTREYFKIPRDILTICQGKSTYARSGVVVNVTPFEPEWEGYATISLSNTAGVPVRIYANEGIAQLIFLQTDEECRQSYGDKKGKYQGQKTITASKSD